MPLTAGERVGDWVLEQPLGQGGMAEVWRAHNVLLPDLVAAVKVAHPAGAPQGDERFLREVQALHRLRHPNVVRVHAFGVHDRRPWVAMELMTGGTLAGPLGVDAAVRVFRGLADGLAHAHAAGVFHRDLKPGNLLVDATTGSAVLADFGIAALEGGARLTETGVVVGTPTYMPPELFRGDAGTPAAADVYALGLVLWEVVTGREAYAVDPTLSAGQQLARIAGQKLAAAPLARVGAPWLDGLLAEMTAPDPARRPTAAEVARRLAVGPPTRTASRAGGGWIVATLGAAVVALVAVLAATWRTPAPPTTVAAPEGVAPVAPVATPVATPAAAPPVAPAAVARTAPWRDHVGVWSGPGELAWEPEGGLRVVARWHGNERWSNVDPGTGSPLTWRFLVPPTASGTPGYELRGASTRVTAAEIGFEESGPAGVTRGTLRRPEAPG